MRLLKEIYKHQGVFSAPKVSTPHAQETVNCRVLLRQALALSKRLPPPNSPRPIAFVAHRGLDYVRAQWAIWLANHIAVPLATHSALPEHLHILKDSGASHVIGHPLMDTTTLPVPTVDFHRDIAREGDENEFYERLEANTSDDAMLVYTSGTTGPPKGVLATHSSLFAQVDDVATAWEISKNDHVLHFLPLHHTHGIVNNLLAPLSRGAHVDGLAKASASEIWHRLSDEANAPTILMAVPSIYMLLLETFDQMDASSKGKALKGVKNLRLAVSGSMACPVSILERWKAISDGQMLLERYGMTECGMALGNPLHGERHIGYVGQPFPSINARLAPETNELQVQGPTLFKGYWNKPAETKKEWTEDGWFKTGDIAEYNEDLQSYRIVGRASVDIIKSAGYKISALDVEQAVMEHPQIMECAVYGVANDTWGQVVTLVARPPPHITDVSQLTPSLDSFLAERLASYKRPRVVHLVSEIPKNAMGKINKKQLPAIFDTQN
ncbi:acyl-CoA synthetase [Thraustotheca clavata]|uniref:Acyl-CoA synthetase n=1 Tax=Thraustotheca clavata TaxID=74557 RepID=A0A1V9ZHU9_9STRA|nr:acyl-CoA synthetase [Thraustotheca clavata]